MGGRQPGVLDVHRHCLFQPRPRTAPGVMGSYRSGSKPMWPLVSIDIQGTGTYRSWWLGIKVLQGITPTGSRKNVKKKFQPTRLVQCMLDMWTPGSLANVKLRYLCSFLFFHESEFAPLRPLYYTVHFKLGWSDVPCHHLGPKGSILHSIQKFVSSFSPSVTVPLIAFMFLIFQDLSCPYCGWLRNPATHLPSGNLT